MLDPQTILSAVDNDLKPYQNVSHTLKSSIAPAPAHETPSPVAAPSKSSAILAASSCEFSSYPLTYMSSPINSARRCVVLAHNSSPIESVNALKFSSNGKLPAIASDKATEIWDLSLDTPASVATNASSSSESTALEWLTDTLNPMLVSGHGNGEIRFTRIYDHDERVTLFQK
ncbi:hypothetical protein VKT23_014680 [Stygiomarasmius scandens]|uniref:Uncharacterized protein n=1 Tax=Marasmiellus scandens TaxID=2682957 RepID=A0ABR1IZY1_9AGAR